MKRHVSFLLASVCLTACSAAPSIIDRTAEKGGAQFNAEAIISVSDLDMAGTGYADRKLRQLPGQGDALSVITALGAAAPSIASIRVSNSVTGWPGPIALSADNRFAYVIETQGEIDDKVIEAEDVYTGAPGTYLTTVDISNMAAPRVVSRTEIGASPTAITLILGGKALAISRRDNDAPLAIVTLKDGIPQSTKRFGFATLIKARREGDRGIPYITANADGTMLALNLANSHIAFARIDQGENGDVSKISPIGAPVEAGKWLSMGRWSADGRHFIATDTGWGPGRYDAVLNEAGGLVSIAFAPDGKHKIVSRVMTSLSPEGIDFSADGRRIAVANMERTYLPTDLPFSLFGRRERYSLSLIAFDQASGKLAMLDGPVGFEGVLPEDVIFDDDGKTLAVAVYHERGETPKAGWIELVAINDDKIVPTGKRIALLRGVHDLAVIRRAPATPQK
jgi:DNA-binding beta-propeller fold protein YncE